MLMLNIGLRRGNQFALSPKFVLYAHSFDLIMRWLITQNQIILENIKNISIVLNL